MKAVRATLVGGLGNQMFIAAASFELAQRLGTRVEFDVADFASDPLKRSYALDVFPGITGCGTRGSGRKSGGPVMFRRKADCWRPDVFVEAAFSFDARFNSIQRPVRLRGYFQSRRYFPNVDATSLFGLAIPNPRLASIHSEVGTDWFGVHVRRTDYLNPATMAFHGVASDGYFLRGLDALKNLSGRDAPMVLFTDDSSAVSNQLRARASLVMEADPEVHEAFDLDALAAAKGLVISNSSFSWWAAFLADRPDRPVVAPRPWIRAGDIAASDLLLPHWWGLGATDIDASP